MCYDKKKWKFKRTNILIMLIGTAMEMIAKMQNDFLLCATLADKSTKVIYMIYHIVKREIL